MRYLMMILIWQVGKFSSIAKLKSPSDSILLLQSTVKVSMVILGQPAKLNVVCLLSKLQTQCPQNVLLLLYEKMR